jgi:hypothetical protein
MKRVSGQPGMLRAIGRFNNETTTPVGLDVSTGRAMIIVSGEILHGGAEDQLEIGCSSVFREDEDRFGIVVGEGVVEPRIEVVSPGGSVPECTGTPLPEPEMAQDALDDILLVDERNDAHFP